MTKREDIRWQTETNCDGDEVVSLHTWIAGLLTEVGHITRMTTGAYTWGVRIGDEVQQCEDVETLDAAKAALLTATARAFYHASVALSGAALASERARRG